MKREREVGCARQAGRQAPWVDGEERGVSLPHFHIGDERARSLRERGREHEEFRNLLASVTDRGAMHLSACLSPHGVFDVEKIGRMLP